MTCSAHAHQGSWMRPNARALVHHVHRADGTLKVVLAQGGVSCWEHHRGHVHSNQGIHFHCPPQKTNCAMCPSSSYSHGRMTSSSKIQCVPPDHQWTALEFPLGTWSILVVLW